MDVKEPNFLPIRLRNLSFRFLGLTENYRKHTYLQTLKTTAHLIIESNILKTGFQQLENREISTVHVFENKICKMM